MHLCRTRLLFGIAFAGFTCAESVSSVPSLGLSLAGEWQLELDRDDVGVKERWFARDLRQSVRLPGSLPEQGFGDPVDVTTKWMGQIVDQSWFTAPEYAPYREPGNIKIPFWLQPETYYSGAAWYRRTIEIPAAWRGRRVALTLERPHWQTRVWVDDRELGSNDSLSTAHIYEIGQDLPPGRYALTVRVDNSLIVDIGANSHSISDHTQGNWNGIVGRIELNATAPVWVDDLQVYPQVATRSLLVKGRVGGIGPCAIALQAEASHGAPPASPASATTTAAADGTFNVEIDLGAGARRWDEFQPALYRVTATPTGGTGKTVTAGLREIATQGSQFFLNGRPLFLRGTLECAIFPKTGHPPTDVSSWRRILGIARAHGLNHLRFHSWCPPEAAFVAADELGFYYLIEIASWAGFSITLGDGKPVDAWLHTEADRILRAYGNHPSFLLMAYGNEPTGKNCRPYLADWVRRYRAIDPRRLHTGGSGWPELPENQFFAAYGNPPPRIQRFGDGLKSRINALPPATTADYRDFVKARPVPVVSHEIGEWCAYPNLEEIPKYTGYLKPKNFEIVRESVAAHGMAAQAKDFLMASGKLQTLCYKEEIESALRTPGMGGFQLLDLHDFPGQGTALVGVLDSFWDSKGYVTPAEYRRFCSTTVPLARLAKRVFTQDETLSAQIEVAHFGAEPLPPTATAWKLIGDDGKTFAHGKLRARAIPIDNGISLGAVRMALRQVPAPARCKLVVTLEGTPFENDWDVWIYPAAVNTATPAGVVVARQTNEAIAALQAGAKVLWLIPPSEVRPAEKAPVVVGFPTIFWNTAWTKRKPPTTLGILCDPKTPALADFPTDFHSNWQWWYLVTSAGAMILDELPPALRPTVQVIDDWVTNHKLGLVLEARVARGRLMVCSIDLDRNDNPVTPQFKHSLLRYLAGPTFQPVIEVTMSQLRTLVTAPGNR